MPLTHVHPALVIPLKRWRPAAFCWTGLIAGSIAPDIPFFAYVPSVYDYSHTWWGALVFDLPLALLTAWLFHFVIKHPLLRAAPRFVQTWLGPRAAAPFPPPAAPFWPRFLLSCIIGIYSHLFWDSFSHKDGWFVLRSPALQHMIYFAQRHKRITVYDALQIIFSGIGFIVIAYCLWRDYQRSRSSPALSAPAAGHPPAHAFPRTTTAFYWCIVSVVALFVCYLLRPAHPLRLRPGTWDDYIVTPTDALLAGLLAAGAAFSLFNHHRPTA